MSAFLPQRDPDRVERERGLNDERERYRYNYNYVSPLALIQRIPSDDEFTWTWMETCASRVLTTLHNHIELEGDSHLAGYLRGKHSFVTNILEVGVELIGSLRSIVADMFHFHGRNIPYTRASELEDYGTLFRKIGLPPIAKDYKDDAVFAYMRIAGPNPVMIKAVTKLDDRFPVTEEIFQSVIAGDSLARAGEEGRLILADYEPLAGLQNGNFPHGQKYIYAPMALFVADRVTKELRPVAIQCTQTPGPESPIFVPDDGYGWLIAKTIVEIADGNLHEAVTHLARTHLLIEPFVITTYRQLSKRHPIHILLHPHFFGTLSINDMAWKGLINDKGPVDKLLGCTIDSARTAVVKGLSQFRFQDSIFGATFQARGVADPNVLGNYPYRDDGLLYWEAIKQWVSAYVTVYYESDADVADDSELRAWFVELGATDGGRLAGLERLNSRDDLIEILTQVIFTCSVQHAAVNFPQYDLMSYVPNMPLAGYTPAPTSKACTDLDYLSLLPPLDMAELQMELGYMLGTVHYSALGNYDEGTFEDARVLDALKRFQEQLANIDQVIAKRNQSRRPYEFLVAGGIPQSINI